MSNLLLLGLALALSFVLTGVMRRYSLAANILDVPNARSAHTRPTPRGGGVAIVVSFNLAVAWLAATAAIPGTLALVLIPAGCVVAVVGYLDDRKPLEARWRFGTHTVAAGWALWCMNGIPPVPMLGYSVNLGWFGLVLATTYLAWMTNLYNFMDGIDGIASVETITVTLGGALCWWLATATTQWLLPVMLAACAAGFLAWNYPPAKIFMGDAGSGFLGIVIGMLSLWTAQEAPQVFWSWFILLGCFMVDTITTLVRRVRRGDRFNEAHRNHAYQYATRKYGSHEKVTLVCGAINVLWLLPLAVLTAIGQLDGVAGTIVAYAPLAWLAFHLKAGARTEQEA